ncbi:MAG: PorT family protein [Candidatus Zixiibacteriota bacterium]|nr:MAG: PorT family protein [candidate division Zixibacteria bacterium]
MKQLTCVILIGLLIGAAAATPAQAGHRIELGPIFALNASKFFGQEADSAFDNDDQWTLNTITGGALARFNFNEKLSVAAQVIYGKRGGRFFNTEPSTDTMSTYSFIVRLDYIEIPVLLRLRPELHSNLNPYIIAGPSIAFAVSGEFEVRLTETTSEGETITEDRTLDRWDLYNASDIQLGMVIGVGLDLQLDRYGFAVEGRYSGDFGNAFTNTSGYDETPEGQAALVHPDGTALQLRSGTLSLMFMVSYALEI